MGDGAFAVVGRQFAASPGEPRRASDRVMTLTIEYDHALTATHTQTHKHNHPVADATRLVWIYHELPTTNYELPSPGR